MRRNHLYGLILVSILFGIVLKVAASGNNPDTLPAAHLPPHSNEPIPVLPNLANVAGPNTLNGAPSAYEDRLNSEEKAIPPNWSLYRNEYSNCSVDVTKLKMNFVLSYPMYQYRYPSNWVGAAYIRHWIMMRSAAAGLPNWTYGPVPSAWYYDTVNLTSLYHNPLVFKENDPMFFTGGYTYGGNPPKRQVLSGYPLYPGLTEYAVVRELYFSDVNGKLMGPTYEYVDFSGPRGSSNVCGYNLSRTNQAFPVNQAATPLDGLATEATPPSMPTPVRYSYIQLPMILRPGTSGATPIPQPSPTATATAIYIPPPTVSSPSTTGNMGNANFDTGPNGIWTEHSSKGFPIVMKGPKGIAARSGEYLAWLGGAHNEKSGISQSITVPTTHPYLSLHLLVYSEEELCYYDQAKIWVDEFWVASISLCQETNFHTWVRGQIDMHQFTGKTVNFKIEMETDATLLSNIFLDDLTFESGVDLPVATPTPVVTPTPQPSGALKNPGFELGDNGDWGTDSVRGLGNIFSHDGAHSGDWLAWLGGAQNEVGYIEQTLYIPHERPYLTYWGRIASEEPKCGVDTIMFLVGSTEFGGYGLCQQYNSASWGRGWVNLKAYSGTTQKIRIRIQTNGSLLSSLYLDDFAFMATQPTTNLAAGQGDGALMGQPIPDPSNRSQLDGRGPVNEPELKMPTK